MTQTETAPMTLEDLERARELAQLSPYSAQFVRETPGMMRRLIAEVEHLRGMWLDEHRPFRKREATDHD